MTTLPECPPGPLLLLIALIDSFCCLFRCNNWRDYLPFGLGDPTFNGPLSHQLPPSLNLPHLTTYTDFLTENNLDNNLSNLYKFAFQTPTTSLGVLTSKDSLVVVIFLVLIIRQIKKVTLPLFCSIGRNVGRNTHGSQWEKANEEKIYKFGEYLFRFIYHSILAVAGVYYFWDKSWWDPTQGGYKNAFNDYPNGRIETGMMWYYLVQCAYNVDAAIHLIQLSFDIKLQNPLKYDPSTKHATLITPIKITWSPTCRGDFNEMAFHHVLTNILVFQSSHYRFENGGSALFVVHDVSDVPVDLSKLANFMKWKYTTIACFVTMVVVWAITRLGLLPFYIIKGIFVDSHVLVTEYGLDIRYYRMLQTVLYPMYILLVALHLFWFHMFIKIGYHLVFKNEIHDLSEHKNGEEQLKKDS